VRSQLLYAQPCCWGCFSVTDCGRLQAVANRAHRWGLCQHRIFDTAQLCDNADRTLLRSVIPPHTTSSPNRPHLTSPQLTFPHTSPHFTLSSPHLTAPHLTSLHSHLPTPHLILTATHLTTTHLTSLPFTSLHPHHTYRGMQPSFYSGSGGSMRGGFNRSGGQTRIPRKILKKAATSVRILLDAVRASVGRHQHPALPEAWWAISLRDVGIVLHTDGFLLLELT